MTLTEAQIILKYSKPLYHVDLWLSGFHTLDSTQDTSWLVGSENMALDQSSHLNFI